VLLLGVIGANYLTLVFKGCPVENALAVDVCVASFENNEEGEQNKERRPALDVHEFDCPWVNECDFEVKNQEKHCDHVVFDRETFVCCARNVGKTAFVSSFLDFGILDATRVEYPVGKQQDEWNANGKNHENGHCKDCVKNFNITHAPKNNKKGTALKGGCQNSTM